MYKGPDLLSPTTASSPPSVRPSSPPYPGTKTPTTLRTRLTTLAERINSRTCLLYPGVYRSRARLSRWRISVTRERGRTTLACDARIVDPSPKREAKHPQCMNRIQHVVSGVLWFVLSHELILVCACVDRSERDRMDMSQISRTGGDTTRGCRTTISNTACTRALGSPHSCLTRAS